MTDLEVLKAGAGALESVSGKIRTYIKELIDDNTFVETDTFMTGSESENNLPLGEGIITGYGEINGIPVYIAAENGEIMGGSFGNINAAKFNRVILRAKKQGIPLVSIIDSSGLRLKESVAAIDSYASVIANLNSLKKKTHHISIIKGNAIGLAGIIAATADITVIDKETGVLSLNSPTVCAACAGFSDKSVKIAGADFHKESGLTAVEVDNARDAASKIGDILNYICNPIVESSDDPNRTNAVLNTAPFATEIINSLVDDGKYLELSSGYATSVKTVLATVNSVTVGIAATNALGDDNTYLASDSIKKIDKFVNFLNKCGIPFICLLDSEGTKASLANEQNGILSDAYELMTTIASSEIYKISVIYGNAIGYSYAALASKGSGIDYVISFPNARIAAIPAKIAVPLYYPDGFSGADNPISKRVDLENKYNAEIASPFNAAKDGGVDNIIEPALIRPYIAGALLMSVAKREG